MTTENYQAHTSDSEVIRDAVFYVSSSDGYVPIGSTVGDANFNRNVVRADEPINGVFTQIEGTDRIISEAPVLGMTLTTFDTGSIGYLLPGSDASGLGGTPTTGTLLPKSGSAYAASSEYVDNVALVAQLGNESFYGIVFPKALIIMDAQSFPAGAKGQITFEVHARISKANALTNMQTGAWHAVYGTTPTGNLP